MKKYSKLLIAKLWKKWVTKADKITFLKGLSLAPSYLSHVTNILLAEDLSVHREPGDEPEELEVVPWKISEMDELLELEDFTEGRSIAALYLVKQFLANNS